MSAEFSWNSLFFAPAKLNLFLHVVGRLPNGYHQLQTVLRLIDYGDFLRFEKSNEIVLKNKIAGVLDCDNLCFKAAQALKTATRYKKGAAIFLEKNLPQGGGLGGGSSDAATVLMALNFLWQTKLSREELMKIAITLGADVPFFIFGEAAFAEGVGEKLQKVQLPNTFYLLLTPNVSCPTPLIFNDPLLKRNTPKIAADSWQSVETQNDLEPVALHLFPELQQVLSDFQHVAPNAKMTGSGACFFAEFESKLGARQAQQALPNFKTQIVQTLQTHPLKNLVF